MKRFLMFLFIGVLSVGLFVGSFKASGQGENASVVGQPFNLAFNKVLTNLYTGTRSYDLLNANNLSLLFRVVQGDPGRTNYVKYQWSNNDSNWVDEPVLVAGAAAGGEVPYTVNSRVIAMGVSNRDSYVYVERVQRLGRWFRVTQKSDSVTTARVDVVVIPLVN